MKIIKARITPLPRTFMDPLPQVHVTVEGGAEQFLFDYYPDEIQFSEREFVGLTLDEAQNLKFQKDKKWLQS